MNYLELKLMKFILLSLIFVVVGQILIPLSALMVTAFTDVANGYVYANEMSHIPYEVVENYSPDK